MYFTLTTRIEIPSFVGSNMNMFSKDLVLSSGMGFEKGLKFFETCIYYLQNGNNNDLFKKKL